MGDDCYPKFETLCRLCLQAEAATINIFLSESSNSQLSIPVRIMACAALEVQHSDGLPKAICVNCRYQLEKCYYFRKRCQLSDNKLKKHLRLLNMGKKSRMFSRTEEEDFEDELEFEDSLNFLKQEDAMREKLEQERNEQWKLTVKDQFKHDIIEKYKEEIKAACKSELRLEVEEEVRNELRVTVREEVRRKLRSTVLQEVRQELWKEVRDEVKADLKTEVALEIREPLKAELREECMEQAKKELRDDLKEECREEQLESLMEELYGFLKTKKPKCPTNAHSLDDILVNSYSSSKAETTNTLHLDNRKAEKRPNETSLVGRAQKQKLETSQMAETSDNEISSSEQTLSYMAVPSETGDAAEETDANYYIVEDEEENDDDDAADDREEQQDDYAYFTHEEANYQIAPSESSDNGATYEIAENGDIKFFKKEIQNETDQEEGAASADNDENILIFDPDFEHDEIKEMVEIVDMDKKPILIKLSSKKGLEMNVLTKTTAKIKRTFNNATSKDVDQVILRTNESTRTIQCTKCPQLFTTQSSMIRHLAMHKILEQKGISFQCPDCKIFLSCKSALNRHMLKHSGRRPFVCEECGKSFIQREILKRHLLTHTGVRPYECPHCKRTFTQKLNLTQHIYKFHTENPKVQQFPCHMCPKRFNHASGLSRHLATHSGVAFQCTECERTFTDRSSVKRHIVHVHGIGTIGKMEPVGKTENSVEEIEAE